MNTPFAYSFHTERGERGVLFMQKGKRKNGKREAVEGSGAKCLILGVAVSALAAVLLLGLCAVLIGVGTIPEKAGEGGVLLACAFGSLVGGRVAVGRKGSGTLLWGLGIGTAMAAVLGVSGFLLYNGLESGRCAAVSGACLCGGGLAGALGGKKRRR